MHPSADRVRRASDAEQNRRIDADIEASVLHHRAHPEDIPARLRALDREWDVERALEANAATLTLAGAVLAATVDRRFLAVPAVVGAFLLQHAVQGWCPPLPILRRRGFRTVREIERERRALEALLRNRDRERIAEAERALH